VAGEPQEAPVLDVTKLVEAAGGVVTRRNADGATEILVVHRPKYDDWSVPKGKLDPGESFEAAAQREVLEETGVRCELGEELPTSRYVDRNGRDKVVRYWSMTPEGESAWEPNDEVDEVRWISLRDAHELLTYDADRRLITAVVERLGGAG
jgi:8-oxo-dGTP diphosphatase